MKFSFRPEVKHHYHILEVSADHKLPEMTSDLQASVAGLGLHPGFKYLTAKLALITARMELELRATKHESLTDIAYLQAGIQWTRWLANQVETAKINRPRMRATTPDETQVIYEPLELIGLPPEPQAQSK